MNSYRKLADLCDDLADFFLGQEPASYIGKEEASKPTITISNSGKYGGKYVEVVWSAWGDLTKDERGKLIVEAYYQAFGEKEGAYLNSAMGLMKQNGHTF
jgi:hypothetical protein